MDSYQIIDEPRGSRLSNATVNPIWPFLALIVGGALSSWLWFVINSIALNSPSRNKELLVVSIAFCVFIAMYLGLGLGKVNGLYEGLTKQYIDTAIYSIEIIFCFTLFLMQQGSFHVYEYFNGKVASPVIGLLLALVVGRILEIVVIVAVLMVVELG